MLNHKYITIVLLFAFISPQLFAQERETVIITDISTTPQKTKEQSEKEYQDSIKKINDGYLKYIEINIPKIQKIDLAIRQIDTTKSINEIEEELNNYKAKIDTQKEFIEKKLSVWFANPESNIDEEYEEITSECKKTQNRIKTLQKWIEKKRAEMPPPKTNWLAIIGIAAGILVMGGIPLIIQLSSKRSARKQQKESEWQTLNAQYQQLPQDLDAAYLPLIENLLLQYGNFMEKRPKKLHKGESVEKVKELKMKKLKIGKKFNIT